MAEVRYPLPKFHFQVDWGQGEAQMGFSEVSGLTVETKIIEYRDGNMPEYTKIKMPGMQEYGNVTLKRGVFEGDNAFFNWWKTHNLNKIERRPVIISLLNENHEPLMTWKLKNAWATKIQSTDLKADGNETAIDTLEIAHEGLVIEA
ncbi:MAG: phage tail protein [Bacteroidia bacterium]|nr:phage tail protein [Bacteroidia bacterium]